MGFYTYTMQANLHSDSPEWGLAPMCMPARFSETGEHIWVILLSKMPWLRLIVLKITYGLIVLDVNPSSRSA